MTLFEDFVVLFKFVGQDTNYFPETIETLAKQGPVSYSFMFRETKKGRNCQPYSNETKTIYDP